MSSATSTCWSTGAATVSVSGPGRLHRDRRRPPGSLLLGDRPRYVAVLPGCRPGNDEAPLGTHCQYRLNGRLDRSTGLPALRDGNLRPHWRHAIACEELGDFGVSVNMVCLDPDPAVQIPRRTADPLLEFAICLPLAARTALGAIACPAPFSRWRRLGFHHWPELSSERRGLASVGRAERRWHRQE